MTKKLKNVPELRFPEFNEDWNERTISDSIKILKSGLSRELSTTDIGLPVIRANNLQNYNLVLDDIKYWFKEDPKGAKTENYYLKKNDILVNFINSEAKMGTSCIIKSDFKRDTIYTTNILRYVTKEAYDSYFHYIYTQTYNYKKWIKIITKPAVNQASFTTIDFKKIPYYIPEFNEQKKIGDFFSKLDRQIELEEQKLAKLEEQKKGYMQKIFLQELRFKDENGNDYPEWKHETLNELNCYFTDGNYGEGYPKSDDMSNFEEGVAFLRGSNLKKGRIVLDNANYISKEKHNELVSGHLYLGDIVIAVRGSLGAVGYVEKNIEGQNINSQLAIIRTLDTKIVSRFLIYYLMSNFGQKELLSKVSGTALKQLPLKEIKSFKTPLPENKEQDKISDFFNKLDKIINKQIKKIDGLKLRKKVFLQKMFV
ncbi:restriction endonuclease subunit S [Staphylococcus equorum]|uniref:restriction endonuclease subunit S n=1 Tax=Staphylococcus equorum TaxID=246432 RepID=UPI002407E715|nr:restriction endonuclease subunit S [Staphylococcus equorum]MDG0826372.1 restriction endonuclease subunit S [Staphylococcus equorum]